METYDSDLFGKLPAPQRIEELLEVVQDFSEDRLPVYMWRGQGDIAWSIDSAAYRKLNQTKKVVTENDLQRYEKDLLERASHQGFCYENGRRLSDFELLAKLQHHGAATRLVDCSRNLLVALWFASSGQKETTGLLLGCHSDHLGGSESKDESRSYTEIVERIKPREHPQTWQPPSVSPRISAQHAQFLYSTVCDKEQGSLWLDSKEKATLYIAITPKFKTYSLNVLREIFDIRGPTLFPDLDGFGMSNSVSGIDYGGHRW